MPLITLREVTKAHSGRTLFSKLTFNIEPGERIGLIGPNGAGKSTLVKIIAGIEDADAGDVIRVKGTRMAYVPQVEDFEGDTVEAVLRGVLANDTADDGEKSVRISVALAECQLEERRHDSPDLLSGGWKKRLAIARALVTDPDLLILDEPTNHLDLDGVLWLEGLLKSANHGTLFISHDRYFLESVARRIVELSPAYPTGTLSSNGGYTDFVENRETFMAQQAHREVALSSEARKEVDWLRRGARARTTKAKGRIEDAGELLAELAATKTLNRQNRKASVSFAASGRGTKELVILTDVSKSYGERVLFSGLDLGIEKRNRLGIIGGNGSGKSTLLKILVGELVPDSGTVKQAHNLRVVYFDQAREGLVETDKLRDALSPNSDLVKVGENTMHVVGWARKFLFRPDQLDVPVSQLSGGERARVLIARLMLKEADVLILDEPTNDLDIPTLDVLEAGLQDFPGALVLVTHDRYLLDRVCDTILALDGQGGYVFVSDTAQWESFRAAQALVAAKEMQKSTASGNKSSASSAKASSNVSSRMTSSEKRELKEMEATIAAAEQRIVDINDAMSDPANASDSKKLAALWDELPAAQDKVASLYERWQELDAKAS